MRLQPLMNITREELQGLITGNISRICFYKIYRGIYCTLYVLSVITYYIHYPVSAIMRLQSKML